MALGISLVLCLHWTLDISKDLQFPSLKKTNYFSNYATLGGEKVDDWLWVLRFLHGDVGDLLCPERLKLSCFQMFSNKHPVIPSTQFNIGRGISIGIPLKGLCACFILFPTWFSILQQLGPGLDLQHLNYSKREKINSLIRSFQNTNAPNTGNRLVKGTGARVSQQGTQMFTNSWNWRLHLLKSFASQL